MGTFRDFQSRVDLSTEALCARILERHRGTIRIKKPHVAVSNLARIVEATLDVANRKGFHSMSLRDLTERSGLSMGALYAYFDGKETLLMMILGQVAAVAEEVLGAPPPELAGDPRGRLRWLLETHVYMTEAMQPWFVFAYMEAKAFPREGRDVARHSELATEAMIAAALDDGVRAGLFAVADVAMTAALVKPLLQDWYVKRPKYRRRGVTPERYAREVTAFVEAAIAAPAVRGAAAVGGDPV
ncbi:MAG TPA: TetR/AcrR family transcriptional regulator [Azospirillum sp.]